MPDTLHEGDVHGLVVIFEVNPAPHSRNDRAPLFCVAQDNRTASLIKLVDSVFFDFAATVEAKLLFNLKFDR